MNTANGCPITRVSPWMAFHYCYSCGHFDDANYGDVWHGVCPNCGQFARHFRSGRWHVSEPQTIDKPWWDRLVDYFFLTPDPKWDPIFFVEFEDEPDKYIQYHKPSGDV